MTELRDRPVIICGHPKAGTTLLRNLLDSHPQLVVFPEETVFFRNFLPKAVGLDNDGLLELARREIIQVFEWNLKNPPAHQAGHLNQDYADIDVGQVAERLAARMKADGVRHLGDVLSAAVLAYGDVIGATSEKSRWWVEKTPYNEQFAEQTLVWWPEARFIHIVRDPLDNYASYQRKHSTWPAGFFSANWNRSTRAGMENLQQYGREKYLLLPYEDLVGDPEANLARICAFLGIEDDPTLRQPTKRGKLWQGNSMFEDRFNAISAAAVGRWESVLDPDEAALIQLVTRKRRRALGYRTESRKSLRAYVSSLYWRIRPMLYDLVKGKKRDW